ncbi:MAG: glycosyltransferase, partial [Candidatus Marinimicrobia bacterium]|nr:glycosyltransferase [Candidatus Neomarinimicrobiota bacterium]
EKHPRAAPGNLPTEEIRATYQSRQYPRLWVIDKENGGKSDALNAGLNYCRTPLYCGMDADTILERDALIRIVRVFLEDVNTIAVGGILRVANGCHMENGRIQEVGLAKSSLARFQVIEYLRAFLTGRMVWAAFRGMLLISGAFGVFRRESVMAAGGYSSRKNLIPTVGEDMELVVRLHRLCYENNRPCQVKFIPDPVAWTEVPENIRGLAAQRDRWHRGMFESLSIHRKMFLNKKYGRIGLLAFPYYFIFELLGPLIELAGYIYFVFALVFGFLSVPFAILFFILAVVFGIAISIASVALEEMTFRRYDRFRDLLLLCVYTFLEQIGFRQLTMFFRLRGLLSALTGRKSWGHPERVGFEKAKKESEQPLDMREVLRR